MKTAWKYLRFEMKKHMWTLAVLSAVCALPYIASLATFDMVYPYPNIYGGLTVNRPQLSFVLVVLVALCFIAPVLAYSFKMNKRGIDGFYALPLKKEKLYLVKTVVGLSMVLVPFTLAHFGGFFTLLLRENNPYEMSWYIPAYFGGVFFGVCMYGINAFLFTRANTVTDGIVFMLAYSLFAYLLFEYYEQLTDNYLKWWVEDSFTTAGGATLFFDGMENLICGYSDDFYIGAFIVPALFGGVGWFLLFFNLRYEKGENAEQVSESWFGYKVIIPLYSAFLVAMSGMEEPLALCLVAVGAVVATVVYRRKFRFQKRYWLMIAGAFALGLLLAGGVEIAEAIRAASALPA